MSLNATERFRVQGLGTVWVRNGLGFRVSGLGFRSWVCGSFWRVFRASRARSWGL